jgi:hypothetical protein
MASTIRPAALALPILKQGGLGIIKLMPGNSFGELFRITTAGDPFVRLASGEIGTASNRHGGMLGQGMRAIKLLDLQHALIALGYCRRRMCHGVSGRCLERTCLCDVGRAILTDCRKKVPVTHWDLGNVTFGLH